MFNATPINNNLIKKHLAIFGTLFNEIRLARSNANGQIVQTSLVPVSYGPQEKFLARVNDDPNLDRATAIQLPRMSFEITGVSYDTNRTMNASNKFVNKVAVGNETAQKTVRTPVPYNFNFSLTIMSKSAEDAAYIVEQILPYFRPSWAVRAQLLREFPDHIFDIYTTLNSCSPLDLYDGDFKERQLITWTLEFTMNGWLFGYLQDVKIIKFADVDFVVDWETQAVAENINVRPGLTANGEPTSNTAESISPLRIKETDNYAIITTITTP